MTAGNLNGSDRSMVATVRAHGALAVALHDVGPVSFQRCALVRDWLGDLGVGRMTLLVIPAPQLHPFPARFPELANWLLDRVDAGDAVAQHGLQPRRTRRPSPLQHPALVRAGAALAGKVLRLDLHPADFDHPRHVLALERVLRRAEGRVAVTYDDLGLRSQPGFRSARQG